MGLVDTTDRNHSVLEAVQDILGGLGGQITAVQNAITALAESVSALSGNAAAMSADVAGLTGKVDAANERIAGLDGKADAIGTGVAGLTGKVDAATMHVDGVGAKVDAANARINELSGKVDAANVCNGDLYAKVEAVESTAAGLHAAASSVGATVNEVHKEVEVLKTTMAGHANTTQLDPAYAEKLDMIPDIQSALAALGDRPDETAALDEISDGIRANSARIAALEDTINRINSQLAGVTGKLGAVESAVEQRVGPAPTSLHKGTEKYTVTLGHFGDSARGKAQGPGRSTLTVTYTFSCKNDVFLGRVGIEDSNINLWAHAKIGQHLASNPATPDVHRISMVEGNTIFDDYFFPGGDRNNYASYVLFNPNFTDFGLKELKAGETLDFKSTRFDNHTHDVRNTAIVSGIGSYIVAKHGGDEIPFPPYFKAGDALLKNVPEPHTKAKLGAIKVYVNTVEYYSAVEKAECAFKRTSGFSTELDKTAQKVLSIRAGTGALVNGFEMDLDCNNLPTMITGINTEVPGGLSLHQHSTFQLLSGSGDKERVHGVFKFNPNGTITRASGDFPFTFEGSPLRINGTLAGAPGLLAVVDYKTTEDNSCR